MPDYESGLLLKNYEIPGGDFTTRRFVFVATVLLVCYNAVFMTSTDMWLGGWAMTLVLFLVAQCLFRRNARIDRVTNAYLSLVESGKSNNGLDTLLKSGAVELGSQCEMNTVCERICRRGKPHPNWLPELLPNDRLLAFMKFCAKNHSDISSGSYVAFVIAEFNGAFKK